MTTLAPYKFQTAPSATGKSRRAVLKASEKRKAQNRAAQKTYREKRKRRLQELEQLAVENGLLNAENGASGSDAHDTPGSDSQSSSQSPPNTTTPDTQLSQSSQTSDPTQLKSSLEPRILELDDLENFDNLINDQSWFTNDLSADISTSLMPTNPQWVTPPTHCNYSSSSSSDTSLDDFSLISPHSKLLHADPLANTLTIRTHSTFSAFMQNLRHLGMPSLDCESEQSSIFHWPDISSDPNAPLLIATVQQSYASLKPDLRPTITQITRAHPSYIDILPFADMRDRLIELLSASPPMADEEEFWMDMDAGGLVCWGSTAPAKGVASAGGGAPWDARSWEAQTWFLAKWNWIVGGEDSELARSSGWWRTMRGVGQWG